MFARSDILTQKNVTFRIIKIHLSRLANAVLFTVLFTQSYCRMQQHSGYKKVLTTIKFYSAHTKQDQENHQICCFFFGSESWTMQK